MCVSVLVLLHEPMQDRVTLLYCDYRDTPATLGAASFDAVVSVEMIEAVGHEHLEPYFKVVSSMLKPGGRAVLQAICCADERCVRLRCRAYHHVQVWPSGCMVLIVDLIVLILTEPQSPPMSTYTSMSTQVRGVLQYLRLHPRACFPRRAPPKPGCHCRLLPRNRLVTARYT